MFKSIPAWVVLAAMLSLQILAPLAAWAEGEDDPLWNRPSYEKKILDVGQRILAANGIKERIAFHYGTKDIRNASARRHLSSNTVTIYKDMVDVIVSDDELAAVLSHEIAHIIRRHHGKAVARKAPIVFGTALVGIAAAVATGGVATPLISPLMEVSSAVATAPISRSLEKDADITGVDYMVNAGYNPLAMETLFTKFVGDAGPFTRLVSTHPVGAKRVDDIHEYIKTQYPQFMTEELANNPVPGSPYKLNETLAQAADKKSAPVKSEPVQSQSERPALNPESQALYSQLSLIAHPEQVKNTEEQAALKPEAGPTASGQVGASAQATTAGAEPQKIASTTAAPHQVETRPTVEASPLKPKPEKIVYRPPQAPQSKTVRRTYSRTPSGAAQAQKPAQPAQTVAMATASEKTSLAHLLLEMSADELRAVKLINQRGYISRREFAEQFEHQDPDTLTAMLQSLVQRKIVRILGAEPEEAYTLTEWAAESFK